MKLIDKTRAHVLRASLGAVALAGSVGAHAAAGSAVDVTDAVGTIGAQLTSISAVGGAVFGVIVVIKAWKWIRRAM
ncbi:major capsid protein [Ramlibacter sp.]|uniref:major capsid protein n=1 Tax=Ramlibacter sp. TaxID=1917967 RepID=UPI0017ADF084|nr:major capsid protein [Ramlibacter sp.]MBA2675548.1 phage coat protein [Ramlibacter sp.]